jgi:iron complex transport system ATP-binding protein
MSDAKAILQADGLAFGYPGQEEFLGPLDLRLAAGHLWGVIGPNGAGKSTLLRLCVGLLKPTGGEVLLEGRRIAQMPAPDRARRAAFLPQRPEALPWATAREIVLLGRFPYRRYRLFESSEDVRIAEEALRQTEMLELADRRLGTLSGGEAQRVHLAAALAQQPRLLVLDEPTSALDPYHQLHIVTILASLVATQGLAIVLATHDLNLAGQFCDRLLLLSEGQVARHGRPDEVLDPAVLESVYRMRFRTVAGADGGPRWVLPDSGDRIVARSAEEVP